MDLKTLAVCKPYLKSTVIKLPILPDKGYNKLETKNKFEFIIILINGIHIIVTCTGKRGTNNTSFSFLLFSCIQPSINESVKEVHSINKTSVELTHFFFSYVYQNLTFFFAKEKH